MNYSLRELECFLAVAEELSFTRAARRLNLAQPPLSRHVRVLEEKLGAVLFEREPRGVSLTPAGHLFYEETRTIPNRLTRAGEAVKRTVAGETARLRLGFVSAVMNDDLVEILRRFRGTHPQVQILLHDAPPHDQLRAIAEGRLDGGFVGIEAPADAAGIEVTPWHREALCCFVASDHPLAGRRQVALKELAKEPFVAVAHEAAPAFAALVGRMCADAGFRPRVILESPRAQAVAVMVAAGSGIAILPAALEKLAGSAVVAVPLKGQPKITHVFARRTGRAKGALGELMALLKGWPGKR
ncbi:LysR family transcriptional regulator [Luteolibacter ambystomatis]|uniref:LysR family transcriptional regulator n=1 Tax=Luteolibacter ambystomatis TaxID=2824561 RepID=A0A975IZ48_9BACT|nr:LysR substrate-binding domain-containing protein [Luteolibacter ambystomatis]QUE49320.1 LysR family transcriptional regulator [Luteolibacter ambystomatis]